MASDIRFQTQERSSIRQESDSFSVCFNIYKLKYLSYDESLDKLDGFLKPNDHVNVFINIESVFNTMTAIRDCGKKILFENEFSKITVANILNLAAHYKRFFKGNKLPTKIFLYYTDFQSLKFNETSINEDYRSYYLNKFNLNPKIYPMSSKLITEVIPEAKQIIEFIPDVYLISAHNIDASVVPVIIANEDKTAKNLIISGDFIDTQYSYIPNFCCHYIRRTYLHNHMSYTIKGHLGEFFGREVEDSEYKAIQNLSIYNCILSAIGDKNRSIDPIKAVGAITMTKKLRLALEKNQITPATMSIEILSSIFNDQLQYKEQLIENYSLLSIEEVYNRLTKKQKFTITNQIVDRVDVNSLIKLNNTRFSDCPLKLEELTM